ncbi:MAG: imidazole glycerol phosphate synthase subunit HisH [Rickettsiales bacterium TMED289]|nr:MAG: imidazole glycerol phosphate synthase subunit HisH [Rickettsiales bacterium TMED289]|tara:strand:- start:483 stop:1097 length:615 start_codon:yes stop_codon:yes gene_type:complete
MISILNYGLGNVGSVSNMISKIGYQNKIVASPSDLNLATKIILPGVGSFDEGMSNLKEGGFIEPLNEMVLDKKIPILGICLGMQLMTKSSQEGESSGLGWIDAETKKFNIKIDGDIKIPHMGWNTVAINKETSISLSIDPDSRYYFVHSYYVSCLNRKDSLLQTRVGERVFDSAFEKENIYGCQFHPEKSHRFGMSFLKEFISI